MKIMKFWILWIWDWAWNSGSLANERETSSTKKWTKFEHRRDETNLSEDYCEEIYRWFAIFEKTKLVSVSLREWKPVQLSKWVKLAYSHEWIRGEVGNSQIANQTWKCKKVRLRQLFKSRKWFVWQTVPTLHACTIKRMFGHFSSHTCNVISVSKWRPDWPQRFMYHKFDWQIFGQ